MLSELSVGDAEATEGKDGTLDFMVTLNRAATTTVTVDYATADATASAGDDYTAANGTLTFNPGDTAKTIAVSITVDTAEEDGETFTLSLSNVSGARLGNAEATGKIWNKGTEHDRPYNLQAVAAAGSITLTWRDPETHASHGLYRILRHRPELGEPEPLVYVAYTSTEERTFTDNAVEPGVLYVYAVQAVKDFLGFLGPASASVNVRIAWETANAPATGAPTVSGTARVGETLTASAGEIADADGLTGAVFTWEWLAHDGTSETPIAGATESTYTLTESEAGKTIRVRVSFTDDGDTEETLVSEATVEVPADTRPVVATLSVGDAAANAERFQVRIVFEAEVTGLEAAELSAAKVGGGAAAVSDLAVVEAGRAWTASVATDGAGRYAVRLSESAALAGARASTAAVLVADVDAEGNATAVDGPAVTAVTFAPDPDGSWTAGEEVRVTLTFSEAVTVAGGTPTLGIGLGSNARQATYASGTGTATLAFVYTLTAADGTVDAVSVTADSLAAGGATIRDAGGRDADLGHPGIAAETEETEAPAVLTGFTLVNLSTVTSGALVDGAELSFEDPANGNFGIRVETAQNAAIGSVRLELSGAKTEARTENVAPWSLYGDDGTTLAGEGLPAGGYTLSATAYSQPKGEGDVLQTLSVFVHRGGGRRDDSGGAGCQCADGGLPGRAGGARRSRHDVRVQGAVQRGDPTSYKVLRDQAFQVSAGGAVTKAKRYDGRDDLPRDPHRDLDLGRRDGDASG